MEERMTKYITDGLSIVRTIVPTGREVFSSPHLRLSPGVCYPPNNLQAINFVDNDGNIVTRYSYYTYFLNRICFWMLTFSHLKNCWKTFLSTHSDFCIGVHLFNVKDIEKFEIITLKYNGSSADMTITCRVGNLVGSVSNEEQLLENDSKVFADRAKILLSTDDVTIGEVFVQKFCSV